MPLGRDRWAATFGVEGLWRTTALLLGGAVAASSRVDSLTTGAVRKIFFAGEGGTSAVGKPAVRFL